MKFELHGFRIVFFIFVFLLFVGTGRHSVCPLLRSGSVLILDLSAYAATHDIIDHDSILCENCSH